MQVIITVDDVGLHPAVRRAVQRLAEQGRITSVSVLANGPDIENCCHFEGLGVGVQLNVLQGRPLSRQEQVSTLLRHDGCFLGEHDVLFKRFLDGKVQLAQIEQEWAAQIEFLMDRSVSVTYLTSHRSMHAWPGLMTVAGRLAQRYAIHWIRQPQRCEQLLATGPRNLSEFTNVCTMLQRLPEPIKTPDLVWGKGQEMGDGQAATFMKDMLEHRPEVAEIVACPGLPEADDDDLIKPFTPGPSRAQWGAAMSIMESEDWPTVWKALDITPIHYGQLDETK